jgi:hypothetical protein
MRGKQFSPSFGVDGILTGTEDHHDNQAYQHKKGQPQFHVLTDGQMTFGIVDHKYGANQNRKLNEADDPGEKPHCDHGASKDVGKHDVMCKGNASEVCIDTCRGHLKIVHVRDKEEAFISNVYTKDNANDIKEGRAMAVTPPFDIGDYAHGSNIWCDTKFTKNMAGDQSQSGIPCVGCLRKRQ